MKNKEQVVSEIKRAFKDSPPNGFLLGWDSDRYYDSLKALCHTCRVTNDTDFNYSFCNSYEFVPELGSVAHVYTITVKLSFIVPAYTLHVTKYSVNKKTGKVVFGPDVPREVEMLSETVREYIETKGFQEIGNEEMDEEVPGVELELADQATIGKCLFDDFS